MMDALTHLRLLSRLESYRIRKTWDNQLVIAFWTCSRLER